MIKVYSYKGCDSCRKALKWLKEREIEFEVLPIRETAPSRSELATMLAVFDGNIKKLFNTSGKDYRDLGLGKRLSSMSVDEAFDLLTENGNLVKRPFMLAGDRGLVGFNEESWTLFFEAI